jgi:GH43 family beta-xylosidase
MDASSWQFLGPLRGMPDHWAIDATVFSFQNSLYCSYSGWPLGDHSDTEQDLFLIRLINPEEADLKTLVCISKPTLGWERLDNRGINEGPQFLSILEFTGIIYSACGSWTNKYKLGALQLVGQDVMSAASWRKLKKPIMMSDPDGRHGPHGPGHAS